MDEKEKQAGDSKSPFDAAGSSLRGEAEGKPLRPPTTAFEGRQAQGKERWPDVLRAKDIIPGAERHLPTESGPGKGENEGLSGNQGFDIPQFNLAQDIMAAQRRQTAVRRKGPAVEDPASPKGYAEASRGPGFAQGATPRQAEGGRWKAQNVERKTQWDSIIADIVARDIERLCRGGSW